MVETMDSQDTKIARQPILNDPQEIRIRRLLVEKLTSTKWSRGIFARFNQLQEEFFRYTFENFNDGEGVLDRYRQLTSVLAASGKTKLVSGEGHLQEFLGKSALIIVTNHLGTAKLTAIDNSDHKFPVPLDSFEPFPIRHAPFRLISDQSGLSLHEAALELPGDLGRVQEICQVLAIPTDGSGRTQLLADKVKSLVTRERAAVVMYPEGGTSGKRNNGGPYDLSKFHSGAFVVAGQLEIPILPVCQYFNPQKGFELYALSPLRLAKGDQANAAAIAVEVKEQMQIVLDRVASQK